MVMHNGQVKKEAKIAQRRQFPDFKVLAPSPRDNQGCSGGEGDLRSWARFLLIHYNRATFVQGSPSLYLCFSGIKFLAILCLGGDFVDSPSLLVQCLAFVNEGKYDISLHLQYLGNLLVFRGQFR